MKLNSVIFHTTKLSEIREFYEGLLDLPLGTYVKNGKTVPDYDDNYVNYHIEGGLLCFEFEEGRTDTGTVILTVPDLRALRAKLNEAGIDISGSETWIKIKDPEGRSLIFEGLAQ